ncbi:TonB-dependent receptor [Asinibacterium sp. OR53]|uniref:TonB-dependent receptor n=1 Tax=Asinibacterium sp. OR53 TaxID=925409 RepID=UPI0004B4F707|nr:TonB-dependent receptor [Asinibacterium sp. OR53]
MTAVTKRILTLFCLFSVSLLNVVYAQDRFTVSGIVKDKSTGEVLIGAAVKIEELNTGTTTNAYGFYAISVKPGTHTLNVSFQGYQLFSQKTELRADLRNDIELMPVSTVLNEVVVSSKRKNEHIAKPVMGVEKLNLSEINLLPVLLGERDVLKSIQLLPGIKSAGEGNSGFFVRGGSADQNLILLDEAPVYNASHLLGFFSTFNSDAIKDVSVYKGSMPAQYGGRLSSVVDIKMKDGNSKDYNVSGGLGLISSRINIEGPIVKDKGSFIISARRTYADQFLKLSKDTTVNNNKLYFYDLNLKANYMLGKRDRLYLSGYFGRDVLGFAETFKSDWGNTTGTLRWNHIFSRNLFSNTSLIYSNYNYVIKIKSGKQLLTINSKIEDLNFKQDFDLFLNNNNKLKFGANAILHTNSPGRVTSDDSAFTGNKVQNKKSLESAVYFSHEIKASERLNLIYGLRLSNLTVLGPGNFYTYDTAGNTTDTMRYGPGATVVSYWNLEPRISASYQLNERRSIKASYTRNVQNLHFLSNTTTSSPTDLWLPSTNNVQPETADQFAIGYYQTSANDQYELTVETYYKWMQHQIDYKSGALLRANDNVENQLLYGVGRAYGIEWLLRKKYGRLSGWVGYTLSKTERRFDQINNGQYFPARQDITHDISVVGIYKLSDRWTLSGTWVYNTGNAVTFPSGKYHVNGQTVFVYTERNGYRMPPYHRLDIAATVENKKNKSRRYQSSWTFGIYNLYGRENAYTITFQDDPDHPEKTQALRTALFKFIPSITWNFKF